MRSVIYHTVAFYIGVGYGVLAVNFHWALWVSVVGLVAGVAVELIATILNPND